MPIAACVGVFDCVFTLLRCSCCGHMDLFAHSHCGQGCRFDLESSWRRWNGTRLKHSENFPEASCESASVKGAWLSTFCFCHLVAIVFVCLWWNYVVQVFLHKKKKVKQVKALACIFSVSNPCFPHLIQFSVCDYIRNRLWDTGDGQVWSDEVRQQSSRTMTFTDNDYNQLTQCSNTVKKNGLIFLQNDVTDS